MTPSQLFTWVSLGIASLSPASGESPVAVASSEKALCEDSQEARVKVDPDLDAPFFASTTKHYPWQVIDHGNGRLEDTLDGVIDPEDRVQIEQTSNCVSDHQGKHEMAFCHAWYADDLLQLRLFGGLPAYASSLNVRIDEDSNIGATFEAPSPAPVQNGLAWRITEKKVHLKEGTPAVGERLYGWIKVTFEERWLADGKETWTPYSIEGFIKPIIRESDSEDRNGSSGPEPAAAR